MGEYPDRMDHVTEPLPVFPLELLNKTMPVSDHIVEKEEENEVDNTLEPELTTIIPTDLIKTETVEDRTEATEAPVRAKIGSLVDSIVNHESVRSMINEYELDAL